MLVQTFFVGRLSLTMPDDHSRVQLQCRDFRITFIRFGITATTTVVASTTAVRTYQLHTTLVLLDDAGRSSYIFRPNLIIFSSEGRASRCRRACVFGAACLHFTRLRCLSYDDLRIWFRFGARVRPRVRARARARTGLGEEIHVGQRTSLSF